MAGRGGTVTVIFLGDAKQLDDTLAHVAAATDATADSVGNSGVKAGEKFGAGIEKGTSKLGAIFSKLGSELGNFGLPFSSELSKIGSELGEVETKGKGFKDALSAVGAVGVAAIAGVAVESVHLADGFDKAQAALETAVKNSGASWSQYKGQVADAAKSSGALVTGNADEVDDALQELTTATRSPATALKDLGAVEDIAAMKHISLADVAQGLVKVYGGSTRILQQWGINLDIGSDKLHSIQAAEEAVQSATLKLHSTQAEINDGQLQGAAASAALDSAQMTLRNDTLNLQQSQQALPDILDQITSRTKGAATTLGDTLAGKITIAKNAIHNLGVEFGEFLLPAIDKIISVGSSVLGFFERNKDAAVAFGVVVGGILTASILAFAYTMATKVVGALASMGSSFVSTAKSVGNSIGIIDSDSKALEVQQAQTASVIEDSNAAIERAWQTLAAAADSIGMEIDTSAASMATAVEAADDKIETANVAAGKSFTAMLGPIGLVAAAAAALEPQIKGLVNSVSNSAFGTISNSAQAQAQYNAAVKAHPGDVSQINASAEKAMKAFGFNINLAKPQAASVGGRPLSNDALSVVTQQIEAAAAKKKTTPGSTIPNLSTCVSTAVSGGAPAGFMTPGDIALESVAKTFQGQLTRAGQGGTGITQQAHTAASIRAALAHTGQEAALIKSLDAANNPTLTGLAQSIETTWSGLANKLAGIVDTDTKQGQSEIQKLQSAASSTSIDTLRSAVTGQAQVSFNQLTTELTSVHSKSLNALVKNLEANFATTTSDYNQVIATLATVAQAAAAQMASEVVGAQTTQLGNVGSAQVGISGLQSTQIADSINNQVTQINDSAKLTADYAAQTVQAIQATTTAIQQAANSQVSSIQDATQTQVDVLGQRGLYGLALVAQQAKIALDQAKAVDDANINAAQAHLDQVTAQTNAAVAQAQTNADTVQQQQDAAVAATQAQADAVAINGAIQAAASQAQVDAQGIVNAINVGTATAHADATQYSTSNVQAQAQAAEQLAQGQAAQTAAQMANQQQVTTNAINMANQNAQNAYNQAQAQAAQQEAIANSQLTAAQNNASTQQALASQQLASIQSQASITEAKLTSIVNLDQELAQVEYAGSGISIYVTGIPADNAAAIGAAASYALRYKAS